MLGKIRGLGGPTVVDIGAAHLAVCKLRAYKSIIFLIVWCVSPLFGRVSDLEVRDWEEIEDYPSLVLLYLSVALRYV